MCKSCFLPGSSFNSEVAEIKQFFNTKLANGVNSKDCMGWTPLHHAIRMRLPNLARQLLEFGADPKSQSDRGETPLGVAVFSKQYHVVGLLLKLLDPIEIKTILPNLGPSIVVRNDFEMAKVFLDHGIYPDEVWMTIAIRHESSLDGQKWIKLFLDNGFEADKGLNQFGRTCLQEALQIGRTDVVKLFVQYGASLRVRNSSGNTAFEQTCQLIVGEEKKYLMNMFKQIVHLESNK